MQENERENNNIEPLARELKEKLDWYIAEASEEEYDERAVEYILYLLDSLEPLAEDKMPRTEEAWQRFRTLVQQRQQALREKPAQEEPTQEETLQNRARQETPANDIAGKENRKAAVKNAVSFVLRHKIMIASLLALLVLAISGAAQTIARQDSGFFQWLKQDNTGKRMITSPENLDDNTYEQKAVYLKEEDLPEWAQEWLQMIKELELPENYVWQRFETNIFGSLRSVTSHYADKTMERDLIFGMETFLMEIAYDSDRFDDYIYVDGYETDTKWMEIYSKEEESGIFDYVIYFIENNRQYFIRGKDDLEELKDMAELYWGCLKK